jgi:hypothetical protein
MGNAIPNSQEYGQDDLYLERSAAFRGPLLGMGEGSQRSHELNRYHAAHNVWVSGLWRGKGPRFRWHTPPAGGGPVLAMLAGKHGAGDAGFALSGRYVLRRVDDSAAGLVVSRDGGAGFVHESAERFWHAGAGASDNLYVAGRASNTDPLGELWRYDGGTWTKAPVPARFLFRIGDRLCRGWGNQISQCSGDPMVAENWTGGLAVGDGTDLISGLSAAAGILVVFTRTGRVFTVNGDGTWNDVFPGLRRTPPPEHLDAPGGQAAPWLNAVWFRNGDAFYRLDVGGGMAISDVGPGRLVDNGSVVGGPVQCFAGHQDWFAFQGVYNPADGNSYLLQYGDWLPQGQGEDAAYRFLDTLHGALVVWPGKRVTALQTSALFGGNPRVYAGFSDGTLGWFNLPRSGPNPFATDAGLDADDFTADPSYLTWPLHTLLASADRKEYLSATAHGPRITPGDFVRVSYWLDPTLLPQTEALLRDAQGRGGAPRWAPGPGTFLATGREAPLPGVQYTFPQAVTAPGQQLDFPADSFAYGIVLREEYGTDQSGAFDAYGTPVVSALVLRERLHPKLRLQWDLRPIAGNRVARRDGVPERKTADQLLAVCYAAAADPKTTILEMPDEVVRGFSVVNYQQTLAAEKDRYGAEYAVDLQLVEFRTETIFGTIDRLGTLSIDGLGERDIDALGTL